MTVSSLVPVNTYTGNSFCKKFDFDFLIESSSELIVQFTDKNGITTTLKEGIDYSINEIGNKEGSYIIFPLETSSYDVLNENEKITLMLTLVIKQESEFRNSSYFNFNILEWTFDYIVRILQILNRKLERCVKVKEGDNISPDNLIDDIKNSEINAKNWFISAKENAEKALEYFQLSKAWAVKTDTKVQKEDFSSKYYAMDAKESAALAAAYVSLRYIPFCVNRGNVENGHPVLLKLEGNILKTQGVFDITTAQGKFYASLSDFSLDISNFPEGKYNIFIDPLEKNITLKNNTVYLGNEFPASVAAGDYLFNISSAPYDLEEKTLDESIKGLGLVLVGTINITGNEKEIVVNPYNKNLQDFKIEQDILNNKVVRIFDIIPKDHILSFEEKEGLELLGEYVYKEAQDGRYGYPDFYNRCLEEYSEAVENQEEIEGITIKIHSNGHKFYDIQDKDKIDEIYSQTGIAWYYGIDTENERILLPRNDYFFQNNKEVGKYIEAGLPNITANWGTTYIRQNGNYQPTGAAGGLISSSNAWASGAMSSINDFDFDASRANPIYGNNKTVQPPSVGVAIYMVVGNTTVTRKTTDKVQVTISENDTIPLFTGQYFDFKPNHASWIKAGTEASGKIYQSAYNELVNIENGSITKYGSNFKVIKESDKLSDVDYSLYWIINTDNQTFKTPSKISYLPYNPNVKSIPVFGNGMTMGLSNGERGFGVVTGPYHGEGLAGHWTLIPYSDAYDQPYGQLNVSDAGLPTARANLGLTDDPTKSGIIADASAIISKDAMLYFKVANAVENQQIINCGEVLEELNNKISKTECEAYIIETYQNGDSWYRIYSDGWCEQGGARANVNDGASNLFSLLKPYRDNAYSLQISQVCKGNEGTTYVRVYDKNSNSFYVDGNGVGYDVNWRAAGYLAEGED